MSLIRKVAVLGSGVMGSGIAAHVANAGIPVLMLDIVPPEAGPGEDTEQEVLPEQVRARRARQPQEAPAGAALHRGRAGRSSRSATSRTTWPRIAECDWVVEVVKEDLAVKQALFAQVEPHLKPGAIISSNTSGLSVTGMLQGRGPAFRKSFLVTHFFNPVRYMKLLELVAGPGHRPRRAGPHGAVRRGDARQGHRLGEGLDQLHRQPHRHLRDAAGAARHAEGGAHRRGGGQDLRPGDGAAEERGVPHHRHRGPRHLRARGAELLRHADPRRGARDVPGPRVRQEDGRREDARRQDRRRLLQEGEGQGRRERDPGARPRHPHLPAADRRCASTRSARPRASTTCAERIRTVLTGTRQGGEVRRAGDAGLAGVRQPPHPGDLRRPGQHRPRRSAGASPGSSARSRCGTPTACARAWSG